MSDAATANGKSPDGGEHRIAPADVDRDLEAWEIIFLCFLVAIAPARIGDDRHMFVELVAVAFGQRFLDDRIDHLWLRGGAGFADHAGADLFFRIFEDLHEMVIIFAAQMLSGEDNAWITDGSAFFKRRTQQTDAGDGAEIGPPIPITIKTLQRLRTASAAAMMRSRAASDT